MKAALDPRFLAYGEAVCRQVSAPAGETPVLADYLIPNPDNFLAANYNSSPLVCTLPLPDTSRE